VEAVVNKDLTAAELAITLNADRLLVLTDVPAVIRGYGTPDARPIPAIDTVALSAMTFPAGSMDPRSKRASLRQGVRPAGRDRRADRLAGWSQVEDQVVAWLRAADQCVAVGGVIDRGGGIADCSGYDGCLAGVAHSGAA
jgi:hypothetical protein